MNTGARKEDQELPEARFKRRLLELGLLTEIKPPLPPDGYPQDRQPVPVEGNPVSNEAASAIGLVVDNPLAHP
jgi:hypothetical protein